MATVSCGERVEGEGATVVAGVGSRRKFRQTKRTAAHPATLPKSHRAALHRRSKSSLAPASRSIAASSPAAWRAYIGTAMSPSAIIARSSAAQRMLFGATRAQRSPFASPEARKKRSRGGDLRRASPSLSRFDRRQRALRPTRRDRRLPASAKKYFRGSSWYLVAQTSVCGVPTDLG